VALQLLFQCDLNPRVVRERIVAYVHAELEDAELEAFAFTLYDGTLRHRLAIDLAVAAAAENWRLPRMAAVDRNVLRLGGYELLFELDTPVTVVLDEAIELARRYGSADSPSFVNGVLDRLRLNAPPRPTPEPTPDAPQ